MKLVGCEGKKKYRREAEAASVARFWNQLGKRFHPYHCYWGNHWHITSDSIEESRRIRTLLRKNKKAKRLKELVGIVKVRLAHS